MQLPRPTVLAAVSLITGASWALHGLLAEPPPKQRTTSSKVDQEAAKNEGALSAAEAVPAEFRQAGVCARCHVLSVLEWGISAHVKAGTDCQQCHGPSEGHVANERNEIKPDRLPRAEAISQQLCSSCHEAGCPETLQVQACQQCHHVHALLDPRKPPAAGDDRLGQLTQRWTEFQQLMAAGDEQVMRQQWPAARTSYQQALQRIPGNQRARSRLQMCLRRLHPQQPGVETVGEMLDPSTGLPQRVRLVGFQTTLLLVVPGEFDLGSDQLADSRPLHTVAIEPFYLGQYEVTQAEWRAIMGSNPSVHQGADVTAAQLPVERVSWEDCQIFLSRLNARIAGGGFRLPTEAEWEYACRTGGTPTLPAAAAEALPHVAWYRDNSLRQPRAAGEFVQVEAYAPRPVGTRRPNAWGFYDMQGNVCEWCSSLFRPYLYNARDGRESRKSSEGMRVLRGGSFADTAAALDPTFRHAERPQRRLRFNGLRLARDVPELSE